MILVSPPPRVLFLPVLFSTGNVHEQLTIPLLNSFPIHICIIQFHTNVQDNFVSSRTRWFVHDALDDITLASHISIPSIEEIPPESEHKDCIGDEDQRDVPMNILIETCSKVSPYRVWVVNHFIHWMVDIGLTQMLESRTPSL